MIIIKVYQLFEKSLEATEGNEIVKKKQICIVFYQHVSYLYTP